MQFHLIPATRLGNSDILILTPTGSVSTLTTNSAPDSAPAWSPDGSMIAFNIFSDRLANLCVIGRDGLNQHCLTTAPSEYSAPVWSPSGASFAVSAKQAAGFGIDIYNVLDSSVVQLYSAGIEPLGMPAWSMDASRVVFQALTGGDMELYIANIATDEFLRITSSFAFDGEPIWISQ